MPYRPLVRRDSTRPITKRSAGLAIERISTELVTLVRNSPKDFAGRPSGHLHRDVRDCLMQASQLRDALLRLYEGA